MGGSSASRAPWGPLELAARRRVHGPQGAERRRPHDREVVVGLTTACTALALYDLFLLATGI